jgi:ribosomal-protein-alanine N-acetyltransferase
MSADPQPTPVPSLIRPCQPGDLPAVEQIIELSSEAAPWSHSALVEVLANHPSHFLVSLYCEEISGFIISRQVAGEAEILNLATHPGYRRHGIATALVKALLPSLSHSGAARVFLEVRESNSAAISLYQVLGFRQTARREAYYHSPIETALILSMELPSHP